MKLLIFNNILYGLQRNVHFYSEDNGAECIVAYYIVFAMRNEYTMANGKKIQILYNNCCLTLQSMI